MLKLLKEGVPFGLKNTQHKKPDSVRGKTRQKSKRGKNVETKTSEDKIKVKTKPEKSSPKLKENDIKENDSTSETEENDSHKYKVEPRLLSELGIDDGPLASSVMVTNLNSDVDEVKLNEVFSLAGDIDTIFLCIKKDGKRKGHGRVTYKHPVQAVQAVSMFNGQTLFDESMTVEMEKVTKLPAGLKAIGRGLGLGGQPMTDLTQIPGCCAMEISESPIKPKITNLDEPTVEKQEIIEKEEKFMSDVMQAIEPLQKHIAKLEASASAWKYTAVEMSRKVDDAEALLHQMQKNGFKASTRSIAIQVSESKVQQMQDVVSESFVIIAPSSQLCNSSLKTTASSSSPAYLGACATFVKQEELFNSPVKIEMDCLPLCDTPVPSSCSRSSYSSGKLDERPSSSSSSSSSFVAVKCAPSRDYPEDLVCSKIEGTGNEGLLNTNNKRITQRSSVSEKMQPAIDPDIPSPTAMQTLFSNVEKLVETYSRPEIRKSEFSSAPVRSSARPSHDDSVKVISYSPVRQRTQLPVKTVVASPYNLLKSQRKEVEVEVLSVSSPVKNHLSNSASPDKPPGVFTHHSPSPRPRCTPRNVNSAVVSVPVAIDARAKSVSLVAQNESPTTQRMVQNSRSPANRSSLVAQNQSPTTQRMVQNSRSPANRSSLVAQHESTQSMVRNSRSPVNRSLVGSDDSVRIISTSPGCRNNQAHQQYSVPSHLPNAASPRRNSRETAAKRNLFISNNRQTSSPQTSSPCSPAKQPRIQANVPPLNNTYRSMHLARSSQQQIHQTSVSMCPQNMYSTVPLVDLTDDPESVVDLT